MDDATSPDPLPSAAQIAEAWRRERPSTPTDSIEIVTPIWRLAKLFADDRGRVLRAAGIDAATLDLLSVIRRAGPPYTFSTREIARADTGDRRGHLPARRTGRNGTDLVRRTAGSHRSSHRAGVADTVRTRPHRTQRRHGTRPRDGTHQIFVQTGTDNPGHFAGETPRRRAVSPNARSLEQPGRSAGNPRCIRRGHCMARACQRRRRGARSDLHRHDPLAARQLRRGRDVLSAGDCRR